MGKLIELIPTKWVVVAVMAVLTLAFMFVKGLHADLVKAEIELAEQTRLVQQWKHANKAWEQAYSDQADYLESMRQKLVARDKQYSQARAKTNKQLEELANAPDPNNVRNTDLGDAFWLPLMERARSYNATNGLSASGAEADPPDSDAGAD